MQRIAVVSIAALTCAMPAQSTSTAVSPADRATLEGSSSTTYPLGRHNSRFQQFYSDLGKARLIQGHAYRRDGLSTRGTIQGFKTLMEIELSATSVTPAQVSKTLAKNPGAAPTRVLRKTWVDFPKTGKPTSIPGGFDFRIPYANSYLFPGKGSLCVDISIHGNQLSTGPSKTFSPSIDAHELFRSGRNLQPGYRFGRGCPATGQTRRASAVFELIHLGSRRLELAIAARSGVASRSGAPAQSYLLLSAKAATFAWPPGSTCQLYGNPCLVARLPGNNTASGSWSGRLNAGIPPAPNFEMIGQILSLDRRSGASALSDASRLITPPAGRGVVSSRVVNASDRTAVSGTVSFSVPITLFF